MEKEAKRAAGTNRESLTSRQKSSRGGEKGYRNVETLSYRAKLFNEINYPRKKWLDRVV